MIPTTFTQKTKILFGSGLFVFGFLFFAFGMLFTVIFNHDISPSRAWGLMRADSEALGTIERMEGTNAYVNDYPVMRYIYRFSPVEDPSATYVDVAFSTGYYEPGQQVKVSYLSGNPGYSLPVDMDASIFGWGGLFTLIFPAVGMVVMVPGLISGARTISILQRGEIARGKLLTSIPTNMTINNMPVMRMTFEFRDAAGRAHFTETKTHKAYSVSDEPDELLIYDPRNPEKAVLVDTLPGFVRHIVEEMEATQRGRRNRGRY